MVLSAVISLILTFVIEKRGRSLGLVQNPNFRSSHTVPTPSGGGMAIAVSGIACGAVLALNADGALLPLIPIFAVIAVLGLLDDLFSLPALLRIVVQALVLLVMFVLIGELTPIPLTDTVAIAGIPLFALAIVAGVWWINLFNFMDGIDGIAGSQSVLICLGAAAIWCIGDSSAPLSSLWWWLIIVASASLGFLFRNWPPAKIFMGDTGSYFLAIAIFCAAAATAQQGSIPYSAWLILVSVFVSDATVTLFRRTLRKESPFEAHRRHAYQILARRFGTHLFSTLFYAALTTLWALPLAFLASRLAEFQWVIVGGAYVPLLLVMRSLGSGDPAEPRERVQ